MKDLLLPTLLVGLQVAITISQHKETEESPIKALLRGYDPKIRAGYNSGLPATVKLNMYMRQFEAVDDDMNVADAQITFRMEWNDDRLMHGGSKSIGLYDPHAIWTPDVFISNSKSGYINQVLMPNILLRINASGGVLYSSRITLQLMCETETERYPMDKVTCPVIIASYGLTTQDEVFLWKDTNPVQISKKLLRSSEFTISSLKTDDCTSRAVTGEYSCLKLNLYLERKPFRTYFFYLYLPSLGLVILSWLTFFISRKASSTVRLTLTLTFAMLMVLICTSLWHIRPHYSVIKQSDVWVFVSAVFVFYAMLHYVVTRFVPLCSRMTEYTTSEADFSTLEKSNETCRPILKEDGRKSEMKSKRLQRLFEKNKADMIARFLYPAGYILFVIVYSATYL